VTSATLVNIYHWYTRQQRDIGLIIIFPTKAPTVDVTCIQISKILSERTKIRISGFDRTKKVIK